MQHETLEVQEEIVKSAFSGGPLHESNLFSLRNCFLHPITFM